MRAWLLLLAVLATFKPIVQVASTEDLSTRFITAISTSSTATTTTSTALAVPFNAVVLEDKTTSSSSSSATASSSAATSFLYKNSNSDSDSNSINKSDENLIIEIKSIEESEGVANEIISPVQENKRTTQVKQLENLEKKHKVKSSEKALQSNRFEAIFSTAFPATSSSSDTTASSKTSQSSETVMAAEESEKSLVEEATQEQHASSSSSSSSISSSAATASSAEQHHHNPNEHRHRHHHQQQSDNSEGSDAAAEADDDSEAEHETFSNKEVISEKLKPDPSTLVEIENSLLSLFNMKRPPKIDRSKIVIPEAMKQLYAQIMGHDIDSVNIPKPGLLTKSANTVRSFTHLDSKIDDRFPHHHRFRLHFDVKSIPAEEKLKAAELQLSRKAISHTTLNPRLATRTRYQVLVYDITRLGIRGKREPTYLLLDNKTIRLNSTDTISLDVQPAVDRWLETPKKNYGLLIEVRTFRALKPAPHHHVRLRRSADETHDDWQHRQPLLFTYTDDGRHKSRSIRDVSTRSKRAGHHRRPHRRKNNEEICRRQSLYVDFTDVGWSDWIVAPPGYDAYYCHGKCPFPLAEHLNSTNHAVVQTLVNNLNPGKVPKACCVPTQLTGISMLYLNDQSTVVLKNYQDMTVVGCGCR